MVPNISDSETKTIAIDVFKDVNVKSRMESGDVPIHVNIERPQRIAGLAAGVPGAQIFGSKHLGVKLGEIPYLKGNTALAFDSQFPQNAPNEIVVQLPLA